MNKDKYLTVSALTKYIKYKIDTDEHLKTVFLKGEISNYKKHQAGHLYFSIKDETSKINAIMFSRSAKSLNFTPQDGTKVLIVGRVSVYEATGNYQIYVEDMIEDGVGNLYIAYEKLKEKLSKEGLFDEKYKQKIPRIPRKIGIITAPKGAAIKDILSTIKRRFPICETILFPSLVQGDQAAQDIVRNLKIANTYDLDVIILGRGGGSIEDLWPFNEEIVAREIFASRIPIISAVGHEVDFTIADFVADLRAPTPTGAAEMAVPNIIDINNHIKQLYIRLNENINKKINLKKIELEALSNSFVIKNPMLIYENKSQKIDVIKENLTRILIQKLEKNQNKLEIIKKNYILNNPTIIYEEKKQKIKNQKQIINRIITQKIEKTKNEITHQKEKYILKNPEKLYQNHKINLKNIIEKLELVNPLETLKRGYTITYQENKIKTKIKEINKNKPLLIKMQDGEIITEIKQIKEN